MTNRPDETWHRLREWTYGQAPSERLSAQILMNEGFVSLDPSHPLGSPDGGKDALCWRDGKKWVMAVYFPRGQQSHGAIKKKLLGDLEGVASNKADGLAFVTNQELSVGERNELQAAAAAPVPIEVYHLERVTAILDSPPMASVRKQFLFIDADASASPPAATTAATNEQGPMRALVVHLEVLREHAYETNVSGSWRSIAPQYDVSRIDDLLPKVPSLTADHACSESLRLIHYWVRRPGEPHAARMIHSESGRLLTWLRSRLGTP